MYSRYREKKFRKQGEMLLSQKRKKYSQNFIVCLQSTQNFVHFEKRRQLHGLIISEVIDPEKCSYFNAGKLLF